MQERLEEIIDGKLHCLSIPSRDQAAMLSDLAMSLARHLGDRCKVVTTAYGLGIREDPITVRIPDLSVFTAAEWSSQPRRVPPHNYVWIAPKLLVECLSPPNRKLSVLQLLADYERAGVPEVWIVSPEQRQVRVYTRGECGLKQTATVTTGSLRPTLLDVEIDVDGLWKVFHRE